MKAKTREKLAARGLGPLVRPGRPGRGRRGALAPQREAVARGAIAGSGGGEVASGVSEVPGYGEVLRPSAGSVRERVRLRPAVRDALDVEAERLGMTREGLCRVVLEEVARNVVGVSPPDLEDSGVPAPIPPGYVGGVDRELDTDTSSGPDPDAGPEPLAARPPLPAGGRSAADAAPVRVLPRVSRLRGLGRGVRVRGPWAPALALVLVVALSVAAVAVSWRYALAPADGDGVYVVDRWQGTVWRCGATARGRPPACAQAVFRRPAAGGDLAYLGRVGR